MPQTSSPPYLSLGELADLIGVQSWRIARLFELGILTELPRIGGRRLIPKTMIPQVIEALRHRGWMKDVETAGHDQRAESGAANRSPQEAKMVTQ